MKIYTQYLELRRKEKKLNSYIEERHGSAFFFFKCLLLPDGGAFLTRKDNHTWLDSQEMLETETRIKRQKQRRKQEVFSSFLFVRLYSSPLYSIELLIV